LELVGSWQQSIQLWLGNIEMWKVGKFEELKSSISPSKKLDYICIYEYTLVIVTYCDCIGIFLSPWYLFVQTFILLVLIAIMHIYVKHPILLIVKWPHLNNIASILLWYLPHFRVFFKRMQNKIWSNNQHSHLSLWKLKWLEYAFFAYLVSCVWCYFWKRG
jgi:hypothetical protein